MQNEANQRRLVQLEGENAQRRNAVRTIDQFYKIFSSVIQTSTLQQVGTHLLQDQMYVQEQVLQYQFVTINIDIFISIQMKF